MSAQQELRTAISELRGCRDFEALKAFMLTSLESQLEPVVDEQPAEDGGVSEEAAAIIALLTDSEKVAVDYFEAIEDLSDEDGLKVLAAKRDTDMTKAQFFALCDEMKANGKSA